MWHIGDCVSLGDHVPELGNMIDKEVQVTYRTFRARVGGDVLDEWAKDHGYETHPAKGLILKNDWHVSYHKSWWYKERCYYLQWSGFEHVWLEGKPC